MEETDMSRLENEKKNIIDACKIWVFIMELLFYSPDWHGR
jgi:hypothetical protein